jgi:hypothetical protein
MQVNRALNVIIPVDTPTGRIFVHSTPISRDLFERYWLVLSKTYSEFQRLQMMETAPANAMRMLRRVARMVPRDDGTGNEWDGVDGVANGLIPEMHRLTNVVRPRPAAQGGGWEPVPLENADLDPDDLAEVESLLAFFTVISATPLRRRGRAEWERLIADSLECQLTSSDCTEYSRSLATSSATASSGATVPI